MASPRYPGHHTRHHPLTGSSATAWGAADAGILTSIHQPGTGIAIWYRPPSPALGAAADQLCTALATRSADPEGTSLRAPLATADPRTVIADLLVAHGLASANLDRIAPLVADMAALAWTFCSLARDLPEPAPIGLRLEVITGTSCPRFHVDQSQLRLLCTYRGPGTEWLGHAQVDRRALYDHQPNDRILRTGNPERLDTCWVGLLKGERYPGNQGCGQVHRSPPAAGMARLLFCLDV